MVLGEFKLAVYLLSYKGIQRIRKLKDQLISLEPAFKSLHTQ